MLQSSNQVPPTPIPNNSATATTTINPMPHMSNNDNNMWAQPKPSIPPQMAQPHGVKFNKYCLKHLINKLFCFFFF